MRLLIVGEIIILILILALGVVKKVKGQKTPKDDMAAVQNTEIRFQPRPAAEEAETAESSVTGPEDSGTEPPEETNEVPSGGENGRETFSEDIEALLAGMTVEQKVAQVFMVTPEVLTGEDQVTIAGAGTRAALQNYPVGGMLYGSGNYVGVPQMRELIGNAQTMSSEYSGQYLFAGAAVEQEGGMVIAAARIGQEEQIGALLNPEATPEAAAVTALIQIPLYQNLDQLSTGGEEAGVKCYLVGENGQGAVEALLNGADMLCVTSGFMEAYQRVYEAVNAQEIPVTALDEAVGRILVGKQAVSEQAEG